MEKPRRVAGTLTCLVAAMTATAGLLGWMDPSVGPPPEGLDPTTVQALIDDLIGDPDLTHTSWREIRVISDLDWLSSGTLLAARREAPDWHFHIDRSGYPSRSGGWGPFASPGDLQGTIYIAVAASGPGERMTAAQAQCLQALVATLNHAFASAYGSFAPVHFDANWIRTYGLAPEAGIVEP